MAHTTTTECKRAPLDKAAPVAVYSPHLGAVAPALDGASKAVDATCERSLP